MKIFAKVSYKGTNYQGWQSQPNEKTVQGSIEKILSMILDNDVHIYASGRTDAGVHAHGQYFHFEVNHDVDLDKLRYSLNRLLPSDIHIISFTTVDDDFNARFSAKEKHYSYTIYVGENDPFINDFAYHFVRPLNIDLFVQAIALFSGKFNFQDFTSKEEDEYGFVRNVSVETSVVGQKIRVDFYGDGFMKYMIRFMIGTAIAIGEKRQPLSFIPSHLQDKKEREIVKFKAPAEGLILEDVKY